MTIISGKTASRSLIIATTCFAASAGAQTLVRDRGSQADQVQKNATASSAFDRGTGHSVSGVPAVLRLADQSTASEELSRKGGQSKGNAETEGANGKRSRLSFSLEEVIVTAQKREEKLMDVPMSITALSGEELTAVGIDNIQNLSFFVPSLTVAETGAGRQMIAIRGIHAQRGTSSLAGIYLDEMPVSGLQDGYIPAYPDLRVVDLARVEVLKGPQGTLFGEGAAGGVIRFITNDPDLSDFGGSISTDLYNTSDGDWSEEVNAVLNAPIVNEVLGVRMAAVYENRSGWIDQPSIGRENINDSEVKHVRVKALYRATTNLQIKGMIEVHRNDGGASNIVNQRPLEDSNFLQAFDRFAPTDFSDDYDLFNLTATYNFGSASLVSSTSYARLDSVQSFTQLIGEEPTPLLEILNRALELDASIASQELRVSSSSGGRFNWTVGAAYKDAEIARTFGEHGIDAILFGGGNEVVITGLLAGEKPTNKSESWAGFADASYEIMPSVEIGAGLRYFYDERETFDPALPTVAELSDSFDKLTYRGYVKYLASDNVNFYVSAANGFRSGGFNAPSTGPRGGAVSYGPEQSASYEAGTKTSLLEGRLRFDAAIFFSRYEDRQADTLITSPVDGGPVQFTFNGGEAEVKGAECDVSWAATDRLMLSLGGNIIDSEITKVGSAEDPALVGEPIDIVPDYSLSASVNYGFQWIDSVPGSIRLDFSRQGKSYSGGRRGNSLTVGNVRSPSGVAPEKNFLNASIGGEIAGWELTLFGRNLLDEEAILFPNESGWSSQARPRTVGLTIGKSF